MKRCRRFFGLCGLALVGACSREAEPPTAEAQGAGVTAAQAAPTNRIAIPAAVRQNLGITFARVERRKVAQTLRVPGRFELLPSARREYRTPLGGRVELLVTQYQRVDAGTALYRVDSAEWRDLHERIAAVQAKVDSMGPIRAAHRVHEKSLADKVRLWQERERELEELRAAGGGRMAQFIEARAALNATQAELAEVLEKDAELQADELVARAELRSLQTRHDLLVKSSGGAHEHVYADTEASGEQGEFEPFEVCAVAPGVVEALAITAGGLAEESGLVLTVVQPERIRFRARGLQADLGRLRDGLPVSVVPPQGGSIPLQDAMEGVLQLGLTSDADERTVDLLMTPTALAAWARAGVAAHMEITLDGGETELAIPVSTVTRDGPTPIIFRRDPNDADKVIRMEADLGVSDGRWVVIKSGVKEGDEIVLDGVYQLMLATAGNVSEGGHFHPDGTFHEGEDK